MVDRNWLSASYIKRRAFVQAREEARGLQIRIDAEIGEPIDVPVCQNPALADPLQHQDPAVNAPLGKDPVDTPFGQDPIDAALAPLEPMSLKRSMNMYLLMKPMSGVVEVTVALVTLSLNILSIAMVMDKMATIQSMWNLMI